jgi:formylglycine-generating enzyme required for sulfatase activity
LTVKLKTILLNFGHKGTKTQSLARLAWWQCLSAWAGAFVAKSQRLAWCLSAFVAKSQRLAWWRCLSAWAGALVAILPATLHATNPQIQNITVTQTKILLNLSWENAWNLHQAPGNHDAVWIFAKIKKGHGDWQHLVLSNDTAAYAENQGTEVDVFPAAQGEGVMVNSRNTSATLQTTLTLPIALPLEDGSYEVQVFAIEMVYVPEGPFWIGDGASNFCLKESGTGQPYFIANETTIPENVLTADPPSAPTGTIPANFPKGYGSFYLMKEEISQAQYVDFLNTLTFTQQTARTAVDPASTAGTRALLGNPANRSNIVVAQSGNAAGLAAVYACDDAAAPNDEGDGQYRACNGLNWQDIAAYLDWAALRPMTELEFEKACRGPLAPIPLEFAWGTDSVVDANTPVHDGETTETVAEGATATAGLASHGYAGVQGPLRGGFGASTVNSRLQMGAGYYGNLEMSGNLWEYCVSIKGAGLEFDGQCGDGSISDAGEADVPTWSSGDGIGFKGGAWNSGVIAGFRDLAISDRFYISHATHARLATAGGRGAR